MSRLRNKKIPMKEFLEIREDVLKQWHTGGSPLLNLENSIERLKNLPDHKNFAKKLKFAARSGRTLVQPRAGVALMSEHIELLKYLEENGGADLLPSTIDSYTRQNRYEEAEAGIRESREAGRSLLNGFPVVNHGVDGCMSVLESVNSPLQARHGTPDARLLSEIIHAAGWTSNEGGGISYNIPYAKNISLEDSITYWQYCDRLVGIYEENGVEINREPFGPLTGTLCPPFISNSVAIIEALLAAEQGVKNITVGYGQGGNIRQDIAALSALKEQCIKYLKKFGYEDVFVTSVFHQWMGGFPADESSSLGLISMASTVASLGKADKMITKTPHESIGIPTKEANAEGLRASKIVTQLLQDQRYADGPDIEFEKNLIMKEVDCVINAVLEAGKNDLAVGTVEAFKQGILDIPFAPSKLNAGKVLPARDNDGKIRLLAFGNVPLSEDLKKYHHDRLQLRADFEDREIDFQMTVDDIYAVSNGILIGRRG
ncbi:MAG: methylaspartate mutase subunit E [Bacilli bacterium]